MTDLDKSDLLAAMVHELRAPLNACLMSLSLLELKASQPADVLKAAEVIRRNLDRQARLIRDLADVVQMLTDGIEVIPERADFGELVDSAVAQCRSAAAERQVEIDRQDPAGTQYPIDADPDRIRQVLDSLLDHVVAAARAGDRVAIALGTTDRYVEVAASRSEPAGREQREPPRGHQTFAIHAAVAEHLVVAHRGSLELNGGHFRLRLPLAGEAAGS